MLPSSKRTHTPGSEYQLARAAIFAAATELYTGDESSPTSGLLKAAEKAIAACDPTAAVIEKLAMLGGIFVTVAKQTLETAVRVRKKNQKTGKAQRRSWKICIEAVLFWCVLKCLDRPNLLQHLAWRCHYLASGMCRSQRTLYQGCRASSRMVSYIDC